MALSVRHSPYTIPSPRFNSMASPTTYNPHFSSGGAGGIQAGAVVPPGPATSYNISSSSMLGLQPSMFSSMSPLATCGTTLQGNLNPSMNLLPPVSNILHLLETHVWSNSHCTHKLVENWLFSADNNIIGLFMITMFSLLQALNSSNSSVVVDSSGPAMGCLSDTSAPDHSPASCCSADSPTSPPDLSVEDSPSPYKSCSVAGCYSSLSPPSSPGALPGSMLNGSRSPPPPSLPLAGSSALPGYPTAAPSSILPSPMYSSQDYSSSSFSSFSSSMPPSFSSSSMPSLSMPMWRWADMPLGEGSINWLMVVDSSSAVLILPCLMLGLYPVHHYPNCHMTLLATSWLPREPFHWSSGLKSIKSTPTPLDTRRYFSASPLSWLSHRYSSVIIWVHTCVSMHALSYYSLSSMHVLPEQLFFSTCKLRHFHSLANTVWPSIGIYNYHMLCLLIWYCQVSTWFANARRRMKKALSEEEESSSQGSRSSSDRENSPDCNSNIRSSN